MTSPAQIWRTTANIPELIGMKGEIISYTRVHNGPKNIEHRSPYYVAIIQLTSSQKNMVVEVCRENEENIASGGEVILVSRKHRVSEKGLIQYVPKAKVKK